MSEPTVNEEVAASMTPDDALDYLRHLPQFQLVLDEVFEFRKKEIEIGLGSATTDTALRQCGQLSEVSYLLDVLRGQ